MTKNSVSGKMFQAEVAVKQRSYVDLDIFQIRFKGVVVDISRLSNACESLKGSSVKHCKYSLSHITPVKSWKNHLSFMI